MSTIGDRIKEERERLKKNQAQMAEYGKVVRSAQANYEKGDRFPDAKYLEGVAKAGVDVLYVLTGMRSESAVPDVPAQRQGAPTYQIEETAAGYDLGRPKREQDSSTSKLAEMQLQLELRDAKMEALRAETEAAKAQARAEIAEARLEILQPQAENFKLVRDLLKRTEAQLVETETAFDEMKAELISLKKNSQRAA